MTAALFLTLSLASLGFAAIRLSTRQGAKEASVYAAWATPPVFRFGGAMGIALSTLPLAMGHWTPGIALVCWLFCVLPLSALPAILCWPFGAGWAVWGAPILFALLALAFFGFCA